MFGTETDFTINTQGLGAQVYERTKEAILGGRIAPGSRITSRDLADRFQVSISPARDALKRLESDGLVEIIPRRGVFVMQVTPDMVLETFQIRQIIECACADHLDTLSEDVILQMTSIVDEMESLREGNVFRNYPRYLELDMMLHVLIVEIVNNKRLTEIYRQLRWPVQLAVVFARVGDRRAVATIAEHKAIVAAASARDRDGIREAISLHLSKACEDLLQHIPSR